jgi:MerR family mercuric resistance operon transcriptional regulator
MPNPSTKESTRIGEVSKRTGCNIETIRYYEKIRLLPEPPRSTGGYRLYGEAHIKRLNFIKRARRLGFSLDEVRGLLSLVDSNEYSCDEVNNITVEHLHEVERKIKDLQKLRRVLNEMASQCEGGQVPECPVIDALFK